MPNLVRRSSHGELDGLNLLYRPIIDLSINISIYRSIARGGCSEPEFVHGVSYLSGGAAGRPRGQTSLPWTPNGGGQKGHCVAHSAMRS